MLLNGYERSSENCRKLDTVQQKSLLEWISDNRGVLAVLLVVGGLAIYKGYDWLSTRSESDIKPPTPIRSVMPKTSKANPDVDSESVNTSTAEPYKRKVRVKFTFTPDTDPEPDEGNEGSQLSGQKKLAASSLLKLPHGEWTEAIDDFGFNEMEEMKNALKAFQSLREVIHKGDAAEIQEASKEFLRVASLLKTLKANETYHLIVQRYKEEHNGDMQPLIFIKSVLMSVYDYAEILAST